MKITTITCEHTRQVTQFNPVRFAISADLTEKDDPEKCAKDLQRLVLMITYKDDPKQKDHLISSLCPKEDTKQTDPIRAETSKPNETTEAEAKEKIAKMNELKKVVGKSELIAERPKTGMNKIPTPPREPMGGNDEEMPNF